ncbi:MAG: protease modulator HflC [Candidatus Anammoxibacter sp.]
MKKQSLILIAIIAFVALIAFIKGSLYVVDVREQIIVTQFGRPIRTVTEPGLYGKIPFIQDVRHFEKRAIEWDGESSDILTRDKENIEVNTWALWRIVDPLRFYTALGAEHNGQGVLDEIIESSVKNIVSAYILKEIVRDTNRKLTYTSKELEDAEMMKAVLIKHGRGKLVEEIRIAASVGLEERYGMQIVDVVIKHINYVSSVIPKIYDRMRSERFRIANKYESEGRREEAEIIGSMTKELDRIESEGYKRAKEIMGDADAQAIKIYADAYKLTPEFYSFLKTLETYKDTFNKDTILILGTKGDYFKYLQSYSEKDAKN